MIEQTCICRKVRAWRSADWLLIDHNQPLDGGEPVDNLATQRFHGCIERVVLFARRFTLTQFVANGIDQKLTDQARLSRPRNSGDARKYCQRNVYVEAVEIIAGDTPEA